MTVTQRRSRAGRIRLLAWNIRHGGGSRLDGIVAALAAHEADVVVLCEYRRSTGPALRQALARLGYRHATTTEPPPRQNGVLIAARRPLREQGPLCQRVAEPHRMIEVRVAGVRIIGVYLPNLLRKVPYWDAIIREAAPRRNGEALFVGDFNTTRHYIDEAGAVCRTSDYMDRIEDAGFRDVYRHHHPDAREFSWYSTAGNGYRLDHAFGSRRLAARVTEVGYSHAERLDRLSDHSILWLGLDANPSAKIAAPARRTRADRQSTLIPAAKMPKIVAPLGASPRDRDR
jgi:exonuclease III